LRLYEGELTFEEDLRIAS